MGQYEWQQQNPFQNPQLWGQFSPQALGHQSFGQHGYGNQGQVPVWGQPALGQPSDQHRFGQHIGSLGQVGGVGVQWASQPRQLSPKNATEVIRQLVPLLPQIIALAQQQHPQPAFGFGQRTLTQQDVSEVVRQILPVAAQIAEQMQGQSPVHAGSELGQPATMGHLPSGQQQLFGQQAYPQLHAAQSPRQLTQQDVSEVVRHLAGVIPQVIHNLQTTTQHRGI
jgi:hypothetical protein